MKIVQIIPNLGLGGAEKFVVSLVNTIAKNYDHEIILITLFGPENKQNNVLKSELNSNVELIQFNKKLGLDLATMRQVYRKINKLAPDVVNMHLNSVLYFIPVMYLNKQIKYFNTIHTYPQREHQHPVLKFIKKRLSRSGRLKIIALTKSNAKNAEELYETQPIKYLENGVVRPKLNDLTKLEKEIEGFKKNKDTVVITHVGRISQVKNQKLLIEAFKKLHEDQLNIILLFIGYATPEDEALKQALIKDSTPNVHFLGKKMNVSDYLALSDGFTLSSHFEGFPISMIEALAVGAVPLCVPAGGIPDIIQHGENGFLTTETNLTAYLEMIKHFLSLSKTDRKKLSENCRQTFENNYEISAVTKKYLTFYQS